MGRHLCPLCCSKVGSTGSSSIQERNGQDGWGWTGKVIPSQRAICLSSQNLPLLFGITRPIFPHDMCCWSKDIWSETCIHPTDSPHHTRLGKSGWIACIGSVWISGDTRLIWHVVERDWRIDIYVFVDTPLQIHSCFSRSLSQLFLAWGRGAF